MTPLEQEVDNHPEWNLLTDQQIADLLNADQVTVRTVLVNALDLDDRWGTTRANQILAKLRQLQTSGGTDQIKEGAALILQMLNGVGMDLGRPAIRNRFPAMVNLTILTQAEANELLALAETRVNRALLLLGRVLVAADITLARWQRSMRAQHVAALGRADTLIDQATDATGTWNDLVNAYRGS